MPAGVIRTGFPSCSAKVWPMTGVLLRAAHDRPGDQVRERDLLAPPRLLQGGVECLPGTLELRHRQFAEGGGGGNGEALVHVLHEARGGTLDRDGPGRAGAGAAAGAGVAATGAGAGSAASATARTVAPVAIRWRRLPDDAALEQLAPLRVDRRGVAKKFLVHHLGEAGVRRLEHIRIHGLLSW